MESKEEFDEAKWDYDRQMLQWEVERAVIALSSFMGCNSFTLPLLNLTVKVTPSNR